jgi:hypothetical protein
MPGFLYWILSGEIYIYKKIDDLYYDNKNSMIEADLEPMG